jgi:hypothetical protein
MIPQLQSHPDAATMPSAQPVRRAPPVEFRDSDPRCIDVGLINNMPDAALDATERQFRALLTAAADRLSVRLTLYTLPEVPRTDFGRQQVRKYSRLDDIRTRRFSPAWPRTRASFTSTALPDGRWATSASGYSSASV